MIIIKHKNIYFHLNNWINHMLSKCHSISNQIIFPRLFILPPDIFYIKLALTNYLFKLTTNFYAICKFWLYGNETNFYFFIFGLCCAQVFIWRISLKSLDKFKQSGNTKENCESLQIMENLRKLLANFRHFLISH